MIYTTNLFEGFNRQLRKFTKIRTVFPTDESLRKSLYLATDKLSTFFNFSSGIRKMTHTTI